MLALTEETESTVSSVGKHRPPPISIPAVNDGMRSSATSLPDLLDRATRLHDVLATGRTTSMLAIDELVDSRAHSAPLYPSPESKDARFYAREATTPKKREIAATKPKVRVMNEATTKIIEPRRPEVRIPEIRQPEIREAKAQAQNREEQPKRGKIALR
jgi:hypothetical protein